MKIKLLFTIVFIIYFSNLSAQIKDYTYKREISGISKTWHKIILPDDIFGKLNRDLSDIRILGITDNKDTIEAPYILKQTNDMVTREELSFKLLNQTYNSSGYFYTFEILSKNPVNQINLNFEQQNFDWRIKLEGSNDQKEWFIIADNYRILSIENDITSYKFTTVSFPETQFRFIRVSIKSEVKPTLLSANIIEQKIIAGNYKNYGFKTTAITEHKNLKQTEIDVSFPEQVPVSFVKLYIQNHYDYYRPINIMYLEDSIKTPKGWQYSYNSVIAGMVSSLEKNEYKFANIISNRFKITISNYDNQPLKIDSVSVEGNLYELIARFTEKAEYFLLYGNRNAASPNYDIEHFTDKIPEPVTAAFTSAEQIIKGKENSGIQPLFQNKLWLWGIMVVIIILLGWFSLKMMRKG